MRKQSQRRPSTSTAALSATALTAIRGGGDLTSGTTEEATVYKKYSNITLKRG